MKKLFRQLRLTTLCMALALPLAAGAQLGQPNIPGMNAAMTKLFGNHTAFTATTTAKLLDDKQAEIMTMPMSYAVLDGKLRSEVDMTQLKSKEMPPEAAASLRQMGMDRMVSIVRPDKQVVIVVYPSLNAYAETPMDKGTAGKSAQDLKVESTKMGNETVDGHPCEKNKVIISTGGNDRQEAIVWNATDMKNFPVKMQMSQPNGTMIMTYSNIKFDKPDAKLFEPPAVFEKYDSVEKLMQTAVMKAIGK
jgi:hypothetical protein